MTWRQLFARVWFFLRAHLKKQHMCPECGDAMWLDYEMGLKPWWRCESCEEFERLKREATVRKMETMNTPLPYPALGGYGMYFFTDVVKHIYEPLTFVNTSPDSSPVEGEPVRQG